MLPELNPFTHVIFLPAVLSSSSFRADRFPGVINTCGVVVWVVVLVELVSREDLLVDVVVLWAAVVILLREGVARWEEHTLPPEADERSGVTVL